MNEGGPGAPDSGAASKPTASNGGNGVKRLNHIDYGTYIGLMRRAFKFLRHHYKEQDSEELESMKIYAKKFLLTLEALLLRHGYSPVYRARPGVDVAISGFPNYMDIVKLGADLNSKEERLPKLMTASELSARILNLVMEDPEKDPAKNAEELKNLRWQFAERAYLEILDLRTTFFQFTPGKVYSAPGVVKERKKDRRAYHISWACYDQASNLPYVYMMVFEHDKSQPALEEGGPELVQLLEALQIIAGRAPTELQAIGVLLDEALTHIYPRLLRRNRIGPIYSPLLYQDAVELNPNSFAARIGPHFKEAGLPDEDFVILFETETVVSDREEAPKGLYVRLGGKAKSRQIFHVPKTDRDLYKRGSSSVRRWALMPHRLRQHLNEKDIKALPELYGKVEFLVYTEDETVRGVEHVG